MAATILDLRLAQQPWAAQSECQYVDPELFFYADQERGQDRVEHAEDAKAVCATCPVVDACLAWALDTREPHGVWGGKTDEERRAILARRDRRQAAS